MEAQTPVDPRQIVDPRTTGVLLSPTVDQFEANGKRYFVERDPRRLTIDRYIEFDRKCIEFGFKGDFAFIVRSLNTAMNFCKDSDPTQAYVTMFNLMHGMNDETVRMPIAIMFCTLFIYREGEDIGKYDTVVAKEKIADWRAEKIHVGFFLDFTNDMLVNFNGIFQAISQAYSQVPMNLEMMRERSESVSGYEQFPDE